MNELVGVTGCSLVVVVAFAIDVDSNERIVRCCVSGWLES